MARRANAISDLRACHWLSLEEALYHFGTYAGPTQSQQHIKPLHWYVASRLVVEGGFHPDDITPRPPFRVEVRGGRNILYFDQSVATGGERTILGGLKTKNVDVVVTKDGIGPVLAVSCKGMTGAFRNLTNRMEETIGECTNLHITYPAMVFGYMFVIRANRQIEAASTEMLPMGNALFGYSSPGYFQYWAGEFTLTNAYTIDSVSGWMGGMAIGGIDIKLYADGGEVPGAELFSQSFVAATYTSDPRWENFQGLNWSVGAGTYWVAFEPQPLDMYGSGFSTTMLVGAPSPLSGYAISNDVSPGYRAENGFTLGFRVEGTAAAVPEPESYALMLAGLALVAGIARCRSGSDSTG